MMKKYSLIIVVFFITILHSEEHLNLKVQAVHNNFSASITLEGQYNETATYSDILFSADSPITHNFTTDFESIQTIYIKENGPYTHEYEFDVSPADNNWNYHQNEPGIWTIENINPLFVAKYGFMMVARAEGGDLSEIQYEIKDSNYEILNSGFEQNFPNGETQYRFIPLNSNEIPEYLWIWPYLHTPHTLEVSTYNNIDPNFNGFYYYHNGNFNGFEWDDDNYIIPVTIDCTPAEPQNITYNIYSNIDNVNATIYYVQDAPPGGDYDSFTEEIILNKGWNEATFSALCEGNGLSSTTITATGVYNETNDYFYVVDDWNEETQEWEVDATNIVFEHKPLHADWNWESFPKLDRNSNNPVLAVPEFESIAPAFTAFEWYGEYHIIKIEDNWNDETYTIQSSDGGKLKALPDADRNYFAEGTRLAADTEVDLPANEWIWIGYWLPNSQMCDEAFGDNWDKVRRIKAEDWYYDDMSMERKKGEAVPVSTKPKPLHYGEGYSIQLHESIDNFSWNTNNAARSKNFEKKEPENFDYEKKADYEVIDVIEIDPEIEEIGVFEAGTCVGGTKVDNNSEQILIYSDRMNRDASEFTFEITAGRNKKEPVVNYQVYDKKTGDFRESVILAGHQDYSIVKLGKIGNNSPEQSQMIIEHSNYPNPFNPQTRISYYLPADGNVDISIYNIKGSKIKKLVSGFLNQGSHSVVWNGKDENNKAAASGIFFYKIKTDYETATGKILLLK